MRQLMLSISFLSSISVVLACGGWSPFGEEIRFSLLDPHLFDDGGMSEFYYSADYLAEMYVHEASSDRNIDDWSKIVGEKISREDIFEAIYRLSAVEIRDPFTNNSFVQRMFQLKREDDLNYLSFAKQYSHLNNTYSDHWEREDSDVSKERNRGIKKALKQVDQVKDKSLKRRYAFVALRLAFYNEDGPMVIELYNHYFKGKQVLAIDAWAKYYYLNSMADGAERNFEVAQMFEHTSTKRHGLFVLFNREIKRDDVLKLARTKQEKANVYFMYSYRQKGRQLEAIKTIHTLYPTHPLLPFLLVREVNKLEDWVLSPKYTAFAPVMREGNDYAYTANDLVKKGVAADELYAKKVLQFLEENKSSLDAQLYASTKALLQFITENPSAALQTLRSVEFQDSLQQMWQQRLLGVLSVMANSSSTVKDIDMELFKDGDYTNKERYIFLMGRTLEFRGKLGDAALLFSAIRPEENVWTWFVWADPKGRTKYNISFYMDYFDYFDANYTARDVEGILSYATLLSRDEKYAELTKEVLKDRNRLMDLIGTKYLRQNELANAVNAFREVPKEHWDSEVYKQNLAANPFYVNFYSEHDETEGDTVSYNKFEIVLEMLRMTELEKLITGDEKAKLNYRMANCYFNMTTYGNSWIMRRSWWSANNYQTVYIDTDEFNKCELAQEHYMKAYKATNNAQFKALCLRMAGRCEKYKMYFEEGYDYNFNYDEHGGYRKYMFKKNAYYQRLQDEFPQWHEELVSNCHSFERFYKVI